MTHRSLRGLGRAARTVLQLPVLVAAVMALAGCPSDTVGNGLPSYRLSYLNAPPTVVAPGQHGSYDILVTRDAGFTGAVTFTAGVNSDFIVAPTTVASSETVAHIIYDIATGATIGHQSFTMHGRSTGAGTDWDISWEPNVVASGTFALLGSETVVHAARGTIIVDTITILRSQFTPGVTLSATVPAGMTASIAGVNGEPDKAIVTVNVGAAIALSLSGYTVTIHGASGTLSSDAPDMRVIVLTESYTLATTPVTIAAGARSFAAVTATFETNFAGLIKVSGEGGPGITVEPTFISVQELSSVVHITVPLNTPPGPYVITLTGVSNGQPNKFATLALQVGPPSGYTLLVTTAPLPMNIGFNATDVVQINRINFAGGVTVTGVGDDAGITVTASPSPSTIDQTTLTISLLPTVTLGQHIISLTGKATGPSDVKTSFAIVVSPPASYALTGPSTATSIAAGTTALNVPITITRTNYTGPVTVTGTGPGSTGITATAALTNSSPALLSVSVPATVVAGSYTVPLQGVSDLNLVAGTLNIVVTAANVNAVAKIVVSPASASRAIGVGASPFSAQLLDAAGAQTFINTPTFSADVSAVASINGSNQLTTFAAGITGVTAFAASSSLFGRGLLRVAGASGISRIAVTPSHTFLANGGDFADLTLTSFDVNNNPITVTGFPITWVSSNPARVTVDANGRVTAVGTLGGGAQITATRDGQTATAVVTLTAGSRGAISGTLVSTSGQYLSNAKVFVNGIQIVTVDAGSGAFIIEGLSPGTYSITVTVDGFPTSTAINATVVTGVITAMSGPVVFP